MYKKIIALLMVATILAIGAVLVRDHVNTNWLADAAYETIFGEEEAESFFELE